MGVRVSLSFPPLPFPSLSPPLLHPPSPVPQNRAEGASLLQHLFSQMEYCTVLSSKAIQPQTLYSFVFTLLRRATVGCCSTFSLRLRPLIRWKEKHFSEAASHLRPRSSIRRPPLGRDQQKMWRRPSLRYTQQRSYKEGTLTCDTDFFSSSNFPMAMPCHAMPISIMPLAKRVQDEGNSLRQYLVR